jgi:hypothetical protein
MLPSLKRRYIYTVLFGVPGLLVAALVTLMLFGAAMGALWLFVFGDNPWPASSDAFIAVVFIPVFLCAWAATLVLGYHVGKQREQDAALNKRHVLLSAGLTALLVLFMLAFQVSNGNLGPGSAETRCGEFCEARGYPASLVTPRNDPPRTCSCLDAQGAAVITIPAEGP